MHLLMINFLQNLASMDVKQGQTNVKSSLEFSIPWMMTRTGGIHRASYSRSSWTCYMRRWHGHATTSGWLAQAPSSSVLESGVAEPMQMPPRPWLSSWCEEDVAGCSAQ
jgi:hypothetical protein